MTRIYILLFTYYMLGLIATVAINRHRKGPDVKESWLKFGVYVIITLGLTSALLFAPWLAIAMAMLIVLIGWFELDRLPRFSSMRKTILLLSYAVLSVLFLIFIARTSHINKLACGVYLVVLSFDGFSQVFGQLIGGRRLAPDISPGKTYAGLIGGLVMGVATAAFLGNTLEREVLLPTLLVCLLAFGGDMLASAVKRKAGIKDYSALIPGHGGVLDRFDSFLFAGAMLQCYFLFS